MQNQVLRDHRVKSTRLVGVDCWAQRTKAFAATCTEKEVLNTSKVKPFIDWANESYQLSPTTHMKSTRVNCAASQQKTRSGLRQRPLVRLAPCRPAAVGKQLGPMFWCAGTFHERNRARQLSRPYTFIVMALITTLAGILAALRMPSDMFQPSASR